MKNILFNSPLRSERYIKNVKKLLDSGNSLHGPGKNILNIKKDLKKKFGFNHVHLTTSCTASMEICALTLNLKKMMKFLFHLTDITLLLPVLLELDVK